MIRPQPQYVVQQIVQYPVIQPRRRRWPIVVAIIASLVVASLVAGVGLVWRTVRGPLPQTSGTLALPGLTSDVQVLRDELGVPHIYADTADDLFRAQGFVHAQERFFEMDLRRHITAGRMAELVGNVNEAIEADKTVRTFGWRRIAEQEWDQLRPETQRWLTDYADGVNAYLAGKTPQQLAMEYAVLGVRLPVSPIEPWTPIDSITWLKGLAWELRSNYDAELQRALIYAARGNLDLVNEILPPATASGAVPIVNPNDPVGATEVARPVAESLASGYLTEPGDLLTKPGVVAALTNAQATIDALPAMLGPGANDGIGSNSWAVSGAHTASGGAMLANDPHLALGIPSLFMQVGLHCNVVSDDCPIDVEGFSFSGFPGVVIGHNDQLAWGITNMGADVTDFFIEEVDGNLHLIDGQWQPMSVRTETINVAGADPIEFEVRMIGDRPIISDVLPVGGAAAAFPGIDLIPGSMDSEDGPRVPDNYAVSLQWTALTPGRSAEAIFEIDTAHNADDMAEAASYFEVPAQSLVFATASGDIGFQAPGRIPIRGEIPGAPLPTDGTWPRDGRDSRSAWQGFYASADLPRILNPAEGFIVAANQPVLPDGAQPFLGIDFDYGTRSQRIRAMLEAQLASGRPITVADLERDQTDIFDPTSDLLLPALLAAAPDDDLTQELLSGWNGDMSANSASAAYFGATWMQLLARIFHDDLPEAAWPNGRSRWLTVVRDLLADPTNALWDDRGTPQVETRDDILRQSLAGAREYLTQRFGSARPADWRWGRMHVLSLEHQVLGGESIPSVVRDFVNPAGRGLSGSTVSVVATAWNAEDGEFDVITGQALRMIVDLGDVDSSVWVNSTGVSGHPASAHYQDQLNAWATGGYFPMPFTRPAVEAATRQVLTLRP